MNACFVLTGTKNITSPECLAVKTVGERGNQTIRRPTLPGHGVILADPAQAVIVRCVKLLHCNDLRNLDFGHWLALQ
jgi:hypothetical protein